MTSLLFAGMTWTVRAFILNDLPVYLYIGNGFFQKNEAIINFEDNTISIRWSKSHFVQPELTIIHPLQEEPILTKELSKSLPDIGEYKQATQVIHTCKKQSTSSKELSEQLVLIMSRFKARSPTLGKLNDHEMKIGLAESFKFFARPRRFSLNNLKT